jgi:hypothetical protein
LNQQFGGNVKRVKTYIGIATTFVLALSSALTVQPALSSVQDMSPTSTLGWVVEEVYGQGSSQVVISSSKDGNSWSDEAYCSEIGAGKVSVIDPEASCDPKDYRGQVIVQYSVLMAPVCQAADRNCISGLSAVGPDGQKVTGQFLGYTAPTEKFIPANRSIGNPEGASSGIWKLPGVMNSLGSDLYDVQLNMENGTASFQNGRLSQRFGLQDRTFSASITPVANENGDSGTSQGNLPLNYNFELSAILPRSIMSWYAGRVSGAEVKYKRIDSTYNQITISGKPITVPSFMPVIPRSEATPELLKVFQFCQSDQPSCTGFYTQGMGKQNFFEPFRVAMKDKASGSRDLWAIRAIYPQFTSSSDSPGFLGCAPRDRASGISTTNAMLFTGNIPKFKGGFFSYEVAGLHYEPDGTTEFLGQYEMAMDEQIARCMFGYPRAPLSATVNVLNKNGTKAIATTTVGVKNKQLRLSAYNFTFSNKTIQVQLKAKGHVTCVRGDTVRYIKGTRCPGGFKKAK